MEQERYEENKAYENGNLKKTGFLIPFIVMLLVISLLVFKDVEEDKAGTYQNMIKMMSDNISEVVKQYVAVVETAADNQNVTSMNADEAEVYLNEIITKSGEVWSHFLITDSEGTEIAHTDGKEHRGTSIAERDYYRIPWENSKTVICEPTFSKSTGRRIMAIGTPVIKDGSQVGVLVGFVRLEYVSQILNEYDITENSYVFMLNSDGTLSAHPNEDIVLMQNWSTQEEGDSQSQQAIAQMSEFQKKVIAKMMAGETGVSSGNRTIYAYAPVEIGGMSLCMVAPFSEAYAVVIILVMLFQAVIVAVSAIGLVTSAMMTKSITALFLWITKQMRELACGNTKIIEAKMGYGDTREVKELKENVSFLSESLESMLSKLDVESQNMTDIVSGIVKTVMSSNEDANSTSATMEELAAAMEEISATTDEMNHSTERTANIIERIVKESEEGSSFAKES